MEVHFLLERGFVQFHVNWCEGMIILGLFLGIKVRHWLKLFPLLLEVDF